MRTAACALALVLLAVPAAAQTRERGYIALSVGSQIPPGAFTDRSVYTVNVEDATTDARYPAKAGLIFDAGVGRRFWRTVGAALHVSRSSVAGTVRTESLIPHPFFDNRHREVAGETGDLEHSETAVHVQVYYVRDFGRWRLRLGAGPSYFTVSKEVATGVTVNEQFPFDTATFRSTTTERGKDSSPGFNAGADIGWMFTRRLGAAALMRFARGTLELNLDGTHRVSTHAGGAQAGAGIRISF